MARDTVNLKNIIVYILRWTHQFDSVQLFVDRVLVNSTIPQGLYRKLDFSQQVCKCRK